MISQCHWHRRRRCPTPSSSVWGGLQGPSRGLVGSFLLLALTLCSPQGVQAYCREQGSCSGYTPYSHGQTDGWCCMFYSCYCTYCCDYSRYRSSPPPPPPPPPTLTCSGTTYLSSSTGSFSDGSSSSRAYSNGLDCRWIIQPGYSGIKLDFSRFSTESGYDKVYVYAGSSVSSSALLGTFSGSSTPGTIIASGTSMLVRFTSDSYTAYTGFYATYQQYIEARTCSGTSYLSSPSGSFTDGSTTSSRYTNNLNCAWRISPGYSGISLSFSRFRTERNYDYVYIYDGTSTSAPLLATYSGVSSTLSLQSPSTAVVSTGSSMLVVFTSDHIQTDTGFAASYERVATTCSGTTTLSSVTGTFNDGSVDFMSYANNKDCRWLIDPGYAPIRLTFNRFRTQSGYDLVKIYNGDEALESSRLTTLSGLSLPDAVETSGPGSSHKMLVVFTTSSSTTDTGFEAAYTQGIRSCHGTSTLQANQGSLTDGSSSGDAYTRGNDCQWLISPGYTGIRAEFSRFSVQGPGDEVKFYSSSSPSEAALLGTASQLETSYWISDDRVVVLSPTSTLLVSFTSSIQPETSSWSTGFEGTYQQDAGGRCSSGTRLSDSSGNFTDGSSPDSLYGSFLDCSWIISPAGLSSNSQLRLSFLGLDTEENVDVVQIYDGEQATPHSLIASFSGDDLPSGDIMSSTSTVLVTFTSNEHRSGRGFHISYSAPCQANGRDVYEGESLESVFFTTDVAPYGETCEAFKATVQQICQSGRMVTSSTEGSQTSSQEYAQCQVAQCSSSSPQVHQDTEGWVDDGSPGPNAQQYFGADYSYQPNLQCKWLLWPGGILGTTLSTAVRRLPLRRAAHESPLPNLNTQQPETAILFTRLDTAQGQDFVKIYKVPDPERAASASDGTWMGEMVSSVSGSLTAAEPAILVTGSPALTVEFNTASTPGASLGWELGYSSISAGCSFKVCLWPVYLAAPEATVPDNCHLNAYVASCLRLLSVMDDIGCCNIAYSHCTIGFKNHAIKNGSELGMFFAAGIHVLRQFSSTA